MSPRPNPRRLLGAALAFSLLAAAAADAFVPPASFILRRMEQRSAGIRGVSASVAGRVWSDETDVGLDTEGSLHLGRPDRFRLDHKNARGTFYEIWAGGSRSVRQGESAQTQAVSGRHPLGALFLGGAKAFLAERGVDLSTVSLARLDHHLCWVIGAEAGDGKKAQLWVSKDSFLPVRWLASEGEGDARKTLDWRFDDYDRSDATTAFPRALELRVNGVRLLRLAVVRIDVSRDPAESTFTSSALPGPR